MKEIHLITRNQPAFQMKNRFNKDRIAYSSHNVYPFKQKKINKQTSGSKCSEDTPSLLDQIQKVVQK